MANDIKNIDNQVKKLIDNITKLEEEINAYKTGHEAFEKASSSLKDLAKAQEDLTKTVSNSLDKLEKIDAVAITKRIDEVSSNLTSTASRLDALVKNMATKKDIEIIRKEHEIIVEWLKAINTHLNEGVIVKKKGLFS